ncbi:MAG: zinc-binding alcohol dehydrogenase family protein [Lactobacillus sp.]|jgi:zinc-binding alcohol dehydrogenase family protein|nr:zinc-binding alcohol dehydrogenase family protein [Lactobacillus sp.]
MTLPTTTKAIGFYEGFELKGDKPGFQDLVLPLPVLRAQDLLVQVQAVSVNPVDTKQRQTQAKTSKPRILGFDGVGQVVAKGEAVTDFDLGDMVYYAGTTKRPGSNMAYQAIDSRLVAKKPTTLDVSASAALPLTSLTAWELLFEKLGFTPAANANRGQKILVVNGAGGVGSMLMQLAKWSGLRVYATASNQNFDWLMQYGADVTLDYHQNIAEQLRAVDIVNVDGIAILYNPTNYFQMAADLIKPFGHIASLVDVKTLPIGLLKPKSASFDWEFMFTKSDYNVNMASQGQILQQVAQLVDQGVVKTTLREVITGINAQTLTRAHGQIEAGHTKGKIVLSGEF